MVVGDVDFRLWAEDGVDVMAERDEGGRQRWAVVDSFDDVQARTDCSVCCMLPVTKRRGVSIGAGVIVVSCGATVVRRLVIFVAAC